MSTEARNPRSTRLSEMTAIEIVRLMNEEEPAVLAALDRASENIAIAAERVAAAFQNGGRTVYVGAGTSGRIAASDAAEMPPTFGVSPSRFVAVVAGGDQADGKAVEDAEDDEHAGIDSMNRLGLGSKDVVIGLAASGRTPFTVAAVRHAHQKGVWTCGISNVRSAPLLKATELSILLETGPEVLTGSTRLKAGTAQKLALNRISTAAMVLSGKVVGNLMVDVSAKNAKLRERCVRIVRELTTATSDEARELLEEHDWNVRKVLDVLRPANVR